MGLRVSQHVTHAILLQAENATQPFLQEQIGWDFYLDWIVTPRLVKILQGARAF